MGLEGQTAFMDRLCAFPTHNRYGPMHRMRSHRRNSCAVPPCALRQIGRYFFRLSRATQRLLARQSHACVSYFAVGLRAGNVTHPAFVIMNCARPPCAGVSIAHTLRLLSGEVDAVRSGDAQAVRAVLRETVSGYRLRRRIREAVCGYSTIRG